MQDRGLHSLHLCPLVHSSSLGSVKTMPGTLSRNFECTFSIAFSTVVLVHNYN